MGEAKRRRELISVLIPERGRPLMLFRLIRSLFDTAGEDKGFEVLVAIDEDDPEWATMDEKYEASDGLVRYFVWPRPKTLGEKLNMLAAQAKGGITWFIANDYVMLTHGWPQIMRDAVAALPNGIGVPFPKDSLHPDHASFPIISRKMIEAGGMFAPPWFPYWYVDTWWDEVGLLLGVRPEIAVEVSAPEGRGKPQGLKDVTFWATFFDRMRRYRVRDARGLAQIAWGKDSARTREVDEMIPSREAFCAARNGHLVTPEFAAVWEGLRDDTPTPEYAQVKAYAAVMMDNIAREEPKRTKIFIAVPSGRTWEAATACSVAAILAYSQHRQDLDVSLLNLQMSTISMARNNIVQKALDLDADYIMWIDADMKLAPDTLLRLLSYDRPIIGASYNKRVKNADGGYTSLGVFEPVAEEHAYDDPRQARLLPGGVMLVKTEVYRKLTWPWYFDTFRWAPQWDGMSAFKQMLRESLLAPPSDEVLASLDGTALGDWLATGYKVSAIDYNSEDYAFCIKARRAGYEIWCSLAVTDGVIHLGEVEVTARMPEGVLRLAAE